MERSRSHTGYFFGDERASPVGLAGLRARSATFHGLGEDPLSGRSPTPAMDFLSPHLQNSGLASPSPSPALGAGFCERREKVRAQWRLRNQNPFYDHPQFRQYRSRQDQKEEKDGQKWPPILEDPFLDALLLIPDMGRSKYFMQGALFGRNMIISTYVWMSYCMSLPPRATPNPVNRRDRKAISSHIQVLKNFFKEHRFFHFFFPTKDEEQRRGGKEENKAIESLSLKTNPVLVALSAGRFPDVRPNYEYFAHLLEQNSTVTMRPKTCWIYVSQPDALADKAVGGAEGGLDVTEYYPPQKENLGISHGIDMGVPLHEYTSTVAQTYSGPVKEITKHWETAFPELHETLSLPEPQDEDCLTILEMNVSLELHKKHFPTGSELNGLVEMNIAQPSLKNHQWKCVTRLVRPRELCLDPENANTYFEHTSAVDVQLTHRPGCDDENGYDCASKPRHDVRVPFPAAEWAGMLTNCASYPPGIPQETRRRRGSAKCESEDELPGELTQRDILSRIGMYQELWSAAEGDEAWTRRAVVFWRFRDVHQYSARKKRWVAEAPTAQWRFLTVNDPASEYHLRNAYVSAGVEEVQQGQGVFAAGSFEMNGGDFAGWNMGAMGSNHMRSLSAPTVSFHVGGMPGLTALPSYPSSLESSFGLLPSTCSTESREGSFVEDVPPTDFLGDSLAVVPGALTYGEVDPALQAWEAEMKCWAPAEFGAGAGAEWGGEEEWAPPVHMSLRPEWDEVKQEAPPCGVLGKRAREGEGGERPTRRARTESGMRSVVGRA